MSKNRLIIILVCLALAVAAVIYFWPKGMPKDLLTKDQAEKIVRDLVSADENAKSLAAYLYPEVVSPKSKVYSWGRGEAGGVKDIKKYSYVAWIDREPGNAFFAHATEFIYIDAKTGAVERAADEFWPVINGRPFEGDGSTQVAGASGEVSGTDYRAKVARYVKESLFEAAQAAGGKKLVITEKPANAPKGKYYALVVAGFGRNSWVFLEGAQQMYDGLLGIGYEAGNITFLGQGPARVDPDWNRQGEAKIIKYDKGPKGHTSPGEVESALASIKQKMKSEDSLFVFVISHGYEGGLALGQPLPDNDAASLDYALHGLDASMSAESFSKAVLENLTACEVMVTIDACYSGSEEEPLRAEYKPDKVKRLAAAHSTDKDTQSYGADLRDPLDVKEPAVLDLDNGAPKTPEKDLNPKDVGGEFSSGFIASLSKTVFGAVYGAGFDLDAARANRMTRPYWWRLGEDGACNVPNTAIMPPVEKPLTATTTTATTTKPKPPAVKTISVIPHSGSYILLSLVRPYTPEQCDCCDEDHWHVRNGNTVKTLDGKTVTDPFAKCGLGTIREHPITSIPEPK